VLRHSGLMHRSRIGVILIDHPEELYDAGLAFWAGVQGVAPTPEPDDPDYAGLGRIGSALVWGQRTGSGTPPRVHLDIESDDVPAEVARVIGLGAKVVEEKKGWTILEDPAGVVFCVVPVQDQEAFDRDAVTRP